MAAGTCSITATQPGNSSFSAATPVTRTFTVNPATTTSTPVIGAVVNAASNTAAALPADSYAAIYGTNLAAQTGDPTTVVTLRDSKGVTATAGLVFVGSGQVNILVPEGLGAGPGTLVVSNSAGTSSTVKLQ